MVWGTIASAVGNYIGNKVDADYSWKRQKRMFDMQTDWELYKMQNAHQIEMDDLRKAGLNPALSGTTHGAVGSGAPSGTSVQGLNLGNMGSEAISNMNNLAQVETTKSQTGLNKANTRLAEQQTLESAERTKAIPKKTSQDIKESQSRVLKNDAEIGEIQSNIDNIQAHTQNVEIQNAIDEIEKEVRTGKYGKALEYIDRTAKTLGNIADVFMPLKSAIKSGNKENMVEIIDTFRDGKGREVQKVKRTERKKR